MQLFDFPHLQHAHLQADCALSLPPAPEKQSCQSIVSSPSDGATLLRNTLGVLPSIGTASPAICFDQAACQLATSYQFAEENRMGSEEKGQGGPGFDSASQPSSRASCSTSKILRLHDTKRQRGIKSPCHFKFVQRFLTG